MGVRGFRNNDPLRKMECNWCEMGVSGVQNKVGKLEDLAECRPLRPVTQQGLHDSGFEHPLVGDEGGFVLVTFSNTDIVVSPMDIKFGEEFGVLGIVNQLLNER